MDQKRNPIVLFDLDDTLAQFCAAIVEQMTAADKALLPDIKDEESLLQTIWKLNGEDFQESADAAHTMLKRIYQTTPQFFRHLKPMPGALFVNEFGASDNVLNFFQRNGFEVFICSSPDILNPTCASDKYAWVDQHFGRFFANRLILTKDKSLVHANIIVDDNHSITGAQAAPFWKHIRFTGHAPDACKAHERNLSRSGQRFTMTTSLTSWLDREHALQMMKRVAGAAANLQNAANLKKEEEEEECNPCAPPYPYLFMREYEEAKKKGAAITENTSK